MVTRNLNEVVICASVVKLYEKDALKDFMVLGTNTYSHLNPFVVKEQKIPLHGFSNNAVSCVLRRYRPGLGQELESIDVYDFLNGVYFVAFKLLKNSKGSPEAMRTFKEFACQRTSISG